MLLSSLSRLGCRPHCEAVLFFPYRYSLYVDQLPVWVFLGQQPQVASHMAAAAKHLQEGKTKDDGATSIFGSTASIDDTVKDTPSASFHAEASSTGTDPRSPAAAPTSKANGKDHFGPVFHKDLKNDARELKKTRIFTHRQFTIKKNGDQIISLEVDMQRPVALPEESEIAAAAAKMQEGPVYLCGKFSQLLSAGVVTLPPR